MKLSSKSYLAGIFTTLTAACSGPAGVLPNADGQAVSRACIIDNHALQGLSQLTVQAGSCPQLTLTGKPLVIAADQHLVVANAHQILINGNLVIDGQLSFAGTAAQTPIKLTEPTDQIQVHGTLQLNKVQINGAGALIFGSYSNGPRAVQLRDSEIIADETGAAPTVSLFGGTSNDCNKVSQEKPFSFQNVTVRETAGHRLAFHNLPASTEGLIFAASTENPFIVDLGHVCIPKGQNFGLNARGVEFQADNITVAGSLALTGSVLTVRGEQGIIVDGGTLNSVASDETPTQIIFSSDSPAATKKIQGKNQSNLNLSNTHVKKGAIVVTDSNVTLAGSTVETPCLQPIAQNEPCKQPGEIAAIVAIGDSSVDVSNSKLLPESRSQVVAQSSGDKKPRLTSSGNGAIFTASTPDGQQFPIHQQRTITVDSLITPSTHDGLIALNGTYEGPCITPREDEGMSLRRSFTFENTFEAIPGESLQYKSIAQKVTRTQVNYQGQDCDTPINTSEMIGNTLFFVLMTENEHTGKVTETLTNKMFVGLHHLQWTYHDQNMLDIINRTPDGLCEINDWTANVPKDVTNKRCFEVIIPLPSYFDRFHVTDEGNLQLALDFDDRPEELQDLIPRDINQITTYVRK